MYTREEILRHSPLSLLNIIKCDILSYSALLTDMSSEVRQSSPEVIAAYRQSEILLANKRSEHLTLISRCMFNYAYINQIDIISTIEQDSCRDQAMKSWKMVTASQNATIENDVHISSDYDERNYMYCIAIWNCAYQILYNELDVYNKTFEQFLDFFDDLNKITVTYGDERTEPLFKLIAQIGNYHVNFEA